MSGAILCGLRFVDSELQWRDQFGDWWESSPYYPELDDLVEYAIKLQNSIKEHERKVKSSNERPAKKLKTSEDAPLDDIFQAQPKPSSTAVEAVIAKTR